MRQTYPVHRTGNGNIGKKLILLQWGAWAVGRGLNRRSTGNKGRGVFSGGTGDSGPWGGGVIYLWDWFRRSLYFGKSVNETWGFALPNL